MSGAAAWPAWHCLEHDRELDPARDGLRCAAGHVVPVIEGIPRFVSPSSYADAFGVQWNRFRLTQLDSHSGTTITRDRVRRCLGEALWGALDGVQLLECGAGAGRFTEILLARGARVTSVDLSAAVTANAASFPPGERHRIAQADIRALPFRPGQYDVVFCLGVIQHTPDPEATIAALAAHVRPGGSLVIDHYTYSLSWYAKAAPLYRQLLRRLPPQRAMRIVERAVKLFWPLHVATRRSTLARVLLGRVSPVQTTMHLYPQLDLEQQRAWAILETYDSLTDYYKHFRTARQLAVTVSALGFDDVTVWKGGNGIELRARRPLAA